MNNEIIAAITAGVEAYEGSKAFVVTKITRPVQIVDVICRNPWSKAEGKSLISIFKKKISPLEFNQEWIF